MITLFTGSPGAGKTLSMVDMLSRLPGDRPIYVDGLNGLTLPHIVCDARKWHEELPDGAILVIDEVQRVWRARASGSKVPDSVAALETHRHRGIDVFVTTQAPRLMDSNVRDLVGRHVHIRDTGILGRYWYEWPETNEGINWKACVNKKRLNLPKKSFDLYKSSSLHTTPVRGIPRSLYVGVFALLLLALMVFGVYRIINKTQQPVDVRQVSSSPVKTTSTSVIDTSNDPNVVQSVGYDITQFMPRISSVPESAPAYDHLRVVAAMPQVVGGACMGEVCKCYNAQGVNAGLSSSECRSWMANPPFNPYLVASNDGRAGNKPSPANPVPVSDPLPEQPISHVSPSYVPAATRSPL